MAKRDWLFQAGTANSVRRRDKQRIKEEIFQSVGGFCSTPCIRMKRTCFVFETWSGYVVQVGLRLTTLMPQPPELGWHLYHRLWLQRIHLAPFWQKGTGLPSVLGLTTHQLHKIRKMVSSTPSLYSYGFLPTSIYFNIGVIIRNR